MCTSKKQKKNKKHKQKGKKCQLDNLLVLSGKNLPQCTVGDRSVVCTLHQITKHPSFRSNTSICVGRIQKTDNIFTKTKEKKKSLFTLFWLINSTIKSVVYTSYTSVLLRLRLNEPKHILFPNSHGGRNTGVSPQSKENTIIILVN